MISSNSSTLNDTDDRENADKGNFEMRSRDGPIFFSGTRKNQPLVVRRVVLVLVGGQRGFE